MSTKLFAWLIFGVIGMAAFGYGKKQRHAKTLLLAAALLAYPYFISNTAALWLVGAGLTAALFVGNQ